MSSCSTDPNEKEYSPHVLAVKKDYCEGKIMTKMPHMTAFGAEIPLRSNVGEHITLIAYSAFIPELEDDDSLRTGYHSVALFTSEGNTFIFYKVGSEAQSVVDLLRKYPEVPVVVADVSHTQIFLYDMWGFRIPYVMYLETLVRNVKDVPPNLNEVSPSWIPLKILTHAKIEQPNIPNIPKKDEGDVLESWATLHAFLWLSSKHTQENGDIVKSARTRGAQYKAYQESILEALNGD